MTIDKFLKNDLQHLALNFVEKRTELAYNELYRKLKPSITAYVNSFRMEEEVRNEVVTLVMMKVWLFIDKYDPTLFAFTTWIFKIAKFECFEQIKLAQKHISVEGSAESKIILKPIFEEDMQETFEYEYEEDEPTFVSLSSKEVYDELVNDYIDQMPTLHKNMLQDTFFNTLTYEEIAQKHGCILNTVRSRVHNAKKTLRLKWTADKKAKYAEASQLFIENVNFKKL